MSAIEGHGKKTAFKTWKKKPNICKTFAKLSKPAASIEYEDFKKLEGFVVTMFCPSLEMDSLDEARKALVFEKGFHSQQLPPTSAALKQHILRAYFLAGCTWGSSTVALMNLPDPCNFGWYDVDGRYMPYWTHLQPATKSAIGKNCKCKNNRCSAACGCKVADLNCSSLCACKAQCSTVTCN